jgi:hypothetical protein
LRIPTGFHYSVEDRVSRVHGMKTDLPFRGAFFARVVTGEGDSERVKVETAAGSKVSAFAYPFASSNAWIRGQPEPTTTMISIIGGDTNDIQPVGYFDPAKSGAAAVYRNLASAIRQQPSEDVGTKILPYRSLSPGELDIGSLFSQIYMGKQDVFQARGGLSHLVMDSLRSQAETPMFVIKGHAHQLDSSGSLSDEIRFGTVRRTIPNVSTPTQQTLVRGTGLNTRDASAGQPFAKELTTILSWFGVPGKLLDHRQGIVIEDDGSPAISAQTSKPLRARLQWHTTNGFSTVEIDEAGNTLLETSSDATEGLVVSVPDGDLSISTGSSSGLPGAGGGKFQLKASREINIATDGRSSWVSKDGFVVQTQSRGEIKTGRSLGLKSQGNVNIETPVPLGVKIGDPNKDKHPILVAHPEYISTLTNYFSAQTVMASNLQTYGSNAAQAWSAVGPLTMLLDPSGTVMGLCLAAAAAAGTVAAAGTQVNTAVTQHLPRLNPMPSGFISQKVVSE